MLLSGAIDVVIIIDCAIQLITFHRVTVLYVMAIATIMHKIIINGPGISIPPIYNIIRTGCGLDSMSSFDVEVY